MKLKETFKYYESILQYSVDNTINYIVVVNQNGLDPSGGVLVIDRMDANGMATPSRREYISYKSVKDGKLIGVQRGMYGSMSQAHPTGSIIEAVPMVEVEKEGDKDMDLADYLDTLL